MDKGDFWTAVHDKNAVSSGAGALKAALVFGAVVIATTLIAAPLLGRSTDRMFASRQDARFDTMTTGSIPQQARRTYTIRRSITQPMPDALCIIDSAGRQRGAC